jgi:hypothetical protein
MANLNFKTDLILGNDGENTIKDFLISKGCSFVSSNNDNKYDLTMIKKGVKTTYEIKTDVKCAPIFDTGNIFIEFSSRGKDSGITVSESDWFVTYFQFLNEIWFIKTNELKDLIKNNEFPIFKDAGDIDSQTHGYLIKRKDFKEYFYVYKTT